MLSTTIVHTCRRCGSERIRKNGHAINGAQRAKCLECERTFILEPAGPRYDEKFKEQVLAAYQDRMPAGRVASCTRASARIGSAPVSSSGRPLASVTRRPARSALGKAR